MALCLQAVTSSFRLFEVAKVGLVIIKYFSQLHREQLFVELLYVLVQCGVVTQPVTQRNTNCFIKCWIKKLKVLVKLCE